MGTIKTTNIEPIADNGTVTLGSSGDTFTIPSGVTMVNNGTQTGFGGTNTPNFSATNSTLQTLSSGVNTKLNFSIETYDSDNCYDTSTSRFTPTVAGKYVFFGGTGFQSSASGGRFILYKNGSEAKYIDFPESGAYGFYGSTTEQANGSTDYFEIYGNVTTGQQVGGGGASGVIFAAYKIIE